MALLSSDKDDNIMFLLPLANSVSELFRTLTMLDIKPDSNSNVMPRVQVFVVFLFSFLLFSLIKSAFLCKFYFL